MLYRFLVVLLLLSSSVFAQLPNATGNAVGVSRFGYCDAELAKSGWSPQLVAPPGGFSVSSPSSGGNTGPYQQVAMSGPAGTAVVHLLPGEIIDPIVEGEILDIEGSFDARRIKGAAMQVALVVEQQGVSYAGPRVTITGTGWQQLSHTKLTAASFTRLGRSGPLNPQFGCNARSLRVGFVTILTSTALQATVAIDNWCVTVRTRCCTAANPSIQGVTWTTGVTPKCCEEALTPNAEGGYDFPADADPNVDPIGESVNEVTGYADELYPDSDTSLDTWYGDQPCDSCAGGTIPPEAANPDLQGGLTAAGIEASPDEVRNTVAEIEQVLVDQSDAEPPAFATMLPVVTVDYTPPATPHRSSNPGPWVFHGRDIVFVHGLVTQHLLDYLSGVKQAEATWKNPGSQDAWTVNPEYYRTGYFKQAANAEWNNHIVQLLQQRNIQNRYLVVAYNSNERLSVAAGAILRQIADAMISGEGVVSPDGNTSKFGTPSMVIVDYSTGAPVTSVALAVATLFPNLGVDFIPKHTKAVIAAQGVFSGSRYASAALAASGVLNVSPGFVCNLARMGLASLGVSPVPPNCATFGPLLNTILVDLVPRVMQARWAPIMAFNPVRTLTVAGAHPSKHPVAKWLFLPGYDDGVTNVNSAVANPNAVFFWPSGFGIAGGSHFRAFDAPVAFPDGTHTIPIGPAQVQIVSNMLDSPNRAIGYFVDQVHDKNFAPLSSSIVPLNLVAGGPVPWISPTGMRQPADMIYPASIPGVGVAIGYSSLQRKLRHFSFLLSAADHYRGLEANADYEPTQGERNLEETRALTNPAVYQPYTMVYLGDSGPLLDPQSVPRVVELRRGLRVRFRLTARRRWREMWVFSRRYYLLEGWETKTQFDYVYGSVLRN